MATGLLYDVHGNLPALEAVIADAEAAGADRWLLGGDYVAFGGWPAECLERLRALERVTWVRGNTDRWLTELPDGGPEEAIRMAVALGADREFLYGLPERATLAEGHFCHASPLNDMESFGVEPQDGEDRLLDGVQDRRVVFGHTHVQFRRVRDDGVELINPGSVGMPLDGDHRAAYAVVDDDGRVELRRVAYDHELATRMVEEVLGDAGAVYAARLRSASP
jgi:predicted phosphodiesterase